MAQVAIPATLYKHELAVNRADKLVHKMAKGGRQTALAVCRPPNG